MLALLAGVVLTAACGESVVQRSTFDDDDGRGGSGNEERERGDVVQAGERSKAELEALLDDFEVCDIDSSCANGALCYGVCIPTVDEPEVLGGECGASDSCQGVLECFEGTCVDPELAAMAAEVTIIPLDEYMAGIPEVVFEDEDPTRQSGLELTRTQELPSKVDLRSTGFVPSSGNQGRAGSCMAFAAGYSVASFTFARRDGRRISGAQGNSVDIMSPYYLYNKGRTLAGRCSSGGMHSSEVHKVFSRHGIPTSRVSPYPTSAAQQRALDSGRCGGLHEGSEEAAADNRITRTQTLFSKWRNARGPIDQVILTNDDLTRIKQKLASGSPVVIAMRTPGGFSKFRAGAVRMPVVDGNNIVGGTNHGFHAVVAVGYDDSTEMLLIQNSWGDRWRTRGFVEMEYEVVKRTFLEAWIATAWNDPAPSGNDDPDTPDEGDTGFEEDESLCASGAPRLACGRDRNDPNQGYVIQVCGREYMNTVEKCSGKCEVIDGQPSCGGGGNDDMPAGDSSFEVRIQWKEGVDLDMVLEEAGVGSYSYRSVSGDGVFNNDASCRRNNSYCDPSVTSIELVRWTNSEPRGALSLKVENYSGASGASVDIFTIRDGEVVDTQTVSVPATRRSSVGPISISTR